MADPEILKRGWGALKVGYHGWPTKKIVKRYDKKREKSLLQHSMRKKLRKVAFCSITDCFTKPFKRIINYFLSLMLIRSAIFAFLNQDHAKYHKGKWERQIAGNGKLQYLFHK